MAAGHAHLLHVHGDSRLHRLAPQCKLAATVLFVLAVVATPREAFWAYGIFAILIVALATAARVPLPRLARRLVIEVPVLLFVVLLPVIGSGPRLELLGVSLSRSGLWAAWNVAAKATLGLSATLLLTATTSLPDLVRGLERLRLPAIIPAIAGFMVRYADVVAGDLGRMRVARLSRAHDPRWLWQARAVAASLGVLFVRSFERGERVHQAMLARGYDGTMPALADQAAPPGQWAAALAVPAVAGLLAAAAWLWR